MDLNFDVTSIEVRSNYAL